MVFALTCAPAVWPVACQSQVRVNSVPWSLRCPKNQGEQLKAHSRISAQLKTEHVVIEARQENRSNSPSSYGNTAIDSQYSKNFRPRRREPQSSLERVVDKFISIRLMCGQQRNISSCALVDCEKNKCPWRELWRVFWSQGLLSVKLSGWVKT